MKSIFGFDKIEIISKRPSDQLIIDLLSIAPFPRSIVRHWKVEPFCPPPVYEDSKCYVDSSLKPYKSIFRFTVPSPEFLHLLLRNKRLLGSYKIYYIEIAEDLICKSKEEALDVTEWHVSHGYKIHDKVEHDFKSHTYNQKNVETLLSEEHLDILDNKCFSEDQFYEALYELEDKNFTRIRKESRKEHGAFGPLSLYLGNDRLQYCIYARHSKRNQKPCCRKEWRIAGHHIEKTLGVYSLKTLTSLSAQEVSEFLNKKYIKYAKINYLKYAKMSLEKANVKNIDERLKRGLQLTKFTFQNVYKIKTTSDFVEFGKWWRFGTGNNFIYSRYLIPITT